MRRLFIILLLALANGSYAVETSGPGYSLKVEGEKRLHLETHSALSAPAGYAPGTVRQEALRLHLSGDLLEEYKVEGEFETMGADDEEAVMWLSCWNETVGARLGRFNAALSGLKLLSVSRQAEGGLFWYHGPLAGADLLVSRPRGDVGLERFPYRRNGTYALDKSPVIFESERVELNGRLLKRGRDYRMEYSSGRFYLTPRCLAETGLEEGSQYTVLKVSYEAASGGGAELNAGRAVFTPAPFLRMEAVGIMESRASAENDTDPVREERSFSTQGYGGSVRLGLDSLLRAGMEAGVQKGHGAESRAFAADAEGGIGGKASLSAGFESTGGKYGLAGNSGVEAGTRRGFGRTGIAPVEGVSFKAEYGRGTRPGSLQRGMEEEAYARTDIEAGRIFEFRTWARQRREKGDSLAGGTRFVHGELGKALGPVHVAAGSEVERKWGGVRPGDPVERNPFFLKVKSGGAGRLQYHLGGDVERALFNDSAGMGRREVRGGGEGLLAWTSSSWSVSGTGMARAGEKGYRENSLEARANGKAGSMAELSALFQNSLQQPGSAEAPVVQVEEKRLIAGEAALRPCRALRFTCAPVYRTRRDAALGRELMRESDQRAGAEYSGARIKSSVNLELADLKLREQSGEDRHGLACYSETGFTAPFGIDSRIQLRMDRASEAETNPSTARMRSRRNTGWKAGSGNTMAVSERHSVGAGGSFYAFSQEVDTSGGLALDSSVIDFASEKREDELFLFSSRKEASVYAEYHHYSGKWEAGCVVTANQIRDFRAPDGSGLDGAVTNGVSPEIELSADPREWLSATITVRSSLRYGYRRARSVGADLSLSSETGPFSLSARLCWAMEEAKESMGRTLDCFLDAVWRI